MIKKSYNVLFLCTGNSARSIMAEAILNREGAGKLHAFSAGSHPMGQVNPAAKSLLESLGFDTGLLRSKNWNEFAAPDVPVMDMVITVCDSAAGEICPAWPGQPVTAHWGFPDPAAFSGSPAETAAHFADVLNMIRTRIEIFSALPLAALDRMTIKRELEKMAEPARETAS